MNLLGNAQASQWQAEGWSIPATHLSRREQRR